jgi:hypothetical protein
MKQQHYIWTLLIKNVLKFCKKNCFLLNLVLEIYDSTRAKYHLHCLFSLHNKAARLEADLNPTNKGDTVSNSIALAELLVYIKERKKNVTPISKLSETMKASWRRTKCLSP